jgi:ornithine cyclodeaminase
VVGTFPILLKRAGPARRARIADVAAAQWRRGIIMQIFDAEHVRALLPMDACIEAMAAAMAAVSAGELEVPPRTFMPLGDHDEALLLMPGAAPGLGVYGAKVLGLHPGNPARGLPGIQGFVALFDGATGTPLAIVDGGALTAIRTAAASALATRVLARRDACTHGVLGTGALARTHIEAIAAVRPCTRVVVWGRHLRKARTLAREEAERTGLAIEATADPADAAACDIVSTVTGAHEPVLRGEWVRPGTHVNLVGAHRATTREADSDLVAAARVYTDLLESLFNEGGDVLIPIAEGRIQRSHVAGEIGQVLNGTLAGRASDAEITVYKSHGITAQDLYAAHALYRRAGSENRDA